MRFGFFAVLFIYSFYTNGQKLFIPHQAYASPAEMDRWMPAVANEMSARFIHDRAKIDSYYFGYLFRFRLIAGQYDEALSLIDSLRHHSDNDISRASNAFPFFIYTLTKKISFGADEFERNFDGVLTREYEKLPPLAGEAAEAYFKADLESRQQNYLVQALRFGKSGKDSLTMDEVRNLCFNWLNYKVYTAEHQLARRILSKILRKNFFVEDSVMIPLADGTKVSATIVRSRHVAGQTPVVLKFGIYPATSEVADAKAIAIRGFAGVIADVRGKRLGTGAIAPFEHDADDAYAVIDWISRQPWCNGKVGMFGGSYLGFTTWAATKHIHPALKAIVPMAAVAPGVDFPGLNGMMWPGMLQWFHLVGDVPLLSIAERNNQHWDSAYAKFYESRKPIAALDTIEGRPNRLFQKFSAHPAFDSFWKNMIPGRKDFKNLDIPVLTVTGYYDDDQRGAFYYYNEHLLRNPSAKHWLVIGPWDHGTSQEGKTTRVVNYKLDPVASIDLTELVFEWFDYTLKGKPIPALLKDRVNYEVMGANEWRHSPSVQHVNSTPHRWYLVANSDGDGRMFVLAASPNPNAGSHVIEVKADLSDRRKSTENYQATVNGDQDIEQDSLGRGDYISFFSGVFDRDTDITGSPAVHLTIIPSQPDADLCLNFYEQLSDGSYFQLSNNVFRLSHVKDNEHPAALKPGQEETLTFANTFFVSKRVKKGSRLVFSLGISKSPKWDVAGRVPVTIKLTGTNWIEFK